MRKLFLILIAIALFLPCSAQDEEISILKNDLDSLLDAGMRDTSTIELVKEVYHYYSRVDPLQALKYADLALEKFNEALEARKITGKDDLIAHSYIYLGNIFKNLDQYSEAQLEQKEKQMDQLSELRDLELEKQELKTRIWLIISGVVMLLVLLIFWGFIQKLQQNKKLEEKNLIIESQKERIEQSNIELKRSKELAESASLAKSAFLSNMSHEIRSPMNGIMGLAQILEDEKLTAKQKELVSSIRFSAENLMVIINDILDLSKIESGIIEFSEQPFSIHRMINELVQNQKAQNKKMIAIEKEVDPDIPEMLIGDKTRFYQILVNLLHNAIKFTEEGQVKLKADLRRMDIEEVAIKFQVSDTGIGIPPEKLKRIFERFEQAHTKNSKDYGGTGLGLAISKKLVELQGGSIWVKSKEDKGTTFAFILNFKRKEPAMVKSLEANKARNPSD